MNKQLLNFHLLLIFTLGFSFLAHNYFIENLKNLALLYIINAFVAVVVYWAAFLSRTGVKDYLGYYFLMGTFIKFLIFFIFFLPIFKEDGIISKTEFFSFFIPYVLALVVETISLISLLNGKDK